MSVAVRDLVRGLMTSTSSWLTPARSYSAPATAATREPVGLALRASVRCAKGTSLQPFLPRIQRKQQGGAGSPELATALSRAAAEATGTRQASLRCTGRPTKGFYGFLWTWRARGCYGDERKSSGARGSPAMAMAGTRCSRGDD